MVVSLLGLPSSVTGSSGGQTFVALSELVVSVNKFAQTLNVIRGIRQQTDTAVLFYSAGGKDGIALLDMLARAFPKVICYYMYVVPDLDHIRPYLRWAESYGNVIIRQIPHYQRDAYLKNGFFCDPDLSIKKVRKVGEVEQMVREETGIPYAFSGMKGVDGYMKRMRLKKFAKTGYISDKGMVYPLAEWTNKEVLTYIKARNLPEPFVYKKGDVSQGFVVDLETLLLLRRDFPRDYHRVLNMFPYAEKLIFDYEYKQNQASRDEGDS